MRERTKLAPGTHRFKIGELPDLRIVPIDALLLHEEPDDVRRSALEECLRGERMLKHPPIVTDPGDGLPFIVLDGANRVTALRNLGLEHLPVQVVPLDDPSLEVRSWHHAVERLDRDFFLRGLGGDESIEIGAAGSVPDVNLNGYLCALTFSGGDGIAVGSHGDMLERVTSLDRITGLYRHTPYSDRVSYTNLDDLRNNYPAFGTLVSFKPFRTDELLAIVRAGRRLPAGITRVILPKRALGIDMRLEFLELPISLEEKNRCLREMIHRKVTERSIRFYEEPTFRFDE